MRVGYRLADGREALAVTPLAATPDAILKMPDDTCLPFVLALLATAVFAAMLVRSPALVCAAVAGCAIATAAWLWPRRTLWQRDEPPVANRRRPRPPPCRAPTSRCRHRCRTTRRPPASHRCRSAVAASARAAGGA